ncbi:MAG TPA: hypothetical protein VE545_04820 [Candidatus Dormibacteraeota bacterium]|nr:hypothetical protein [Candidatus Dormibacteraeota bacterium]
MIRKYFVHFLAVLSRELESNHRVVLHVEEIFALELAVFRLDINLQAVCSDVGKSAFAILGAAVEGVT